MSLDALKELLTDGGYDPVDQTQQKYYLVSMTIEKFEITLTLGFLDPGMCQKNNDGPFIFNLIQIRQKL